MHMIVVGDDPDNPEWLECRLAEAGISAMRFDCPSEALAHPATEHAMAALIESGRGTAENASRVEHLRSGGFAQTLLVLAAHSDWRERVRCFDAGVDEYLLKPLRSEELVARLRAIVRRNNRSSGNSVTIGPYSCNLADNTISRDGRPLDLTRNEARLFRIFLLRPNRVLSHAELIELLYPGQPSRTGNAIEVLLTRLRRKAGLPCITTVRGVGYRLSID